MDAYGCLYMDIYMYMAGLSHMPMVRALACR